MRWNVNSYISLCLMGIALAVIITALGWPFRTALFPISIGIAVIVFAAVELIRSLFFEKEAPEAAATEPADPEKDDEVDPVLARQRTWNIFAWILGFCLMILLLGFPVAVPLLVFTYLRFHGKESWGLTLLLTALTFLFFQGLFVWLLNTFFAEGWLIIAIERLLES
ncbi:MAG: tripartite tricarboxylate transporter TctB family protein [Desulfobacterales bacterium]|nr:tripartite tricarboxylate transporter TctB family protein [Desulfobacterales bacterium]